MSSAPTPSPQSQPGMFSEPPREKIFPTTAVAIAAVAVVILVAVLMVLGRRTSAPAANVERAVSSYGDNLRVSNVQLSESESLSGGKSTYVDGHVDNVGDKTITGIQVQVFFADNGGAAPTIDTVPMMLIRMREPYVDVQPVSAAPIAPGTGADFRMIFENVPANWNDQTPVMHAVQVSTK